MKLWHLKWIEEPEVFWDKTMALAVVAESEQQAREIVTTHKRGEWAFPYYGDEGAEPWLNPELTECIEVDMSKPGVIVRDFCEA